MDSYPAGDREGEETGAGLLRRLPTSPFQSGTTQSAYPKNLPVHATRIATLEIGVQIAGLRHLRVANPLLRSVHKMSAITPLPGRL
jgi:hypothetical protein